MKEDPLSKILFICFIPILIFSIIVIPYPIDFFIIVGVAILMYLIVECYSYLIKKKQIARKDSKPIKKEIRDNSVAKNLNYYLLFYNEKLMNNVEYILITNDREEKIFKDNIQTFIFVNGEFDEIHRSLGLKDVPQYRLCPEKYLKYCKNEFRYNNLYDPYRLTFDLSKKINKPNKISFIQIIPVEVINNYINSLGMKLTKELFCV